MWWKHIDMIKEMFVTSQKDVVSIFAKFEIVHTVTDIKKVSDGWQKTGDVSDAQSDGFQTLVCSSNPISSNQERYIISTQTEIMILIDWYTHDQLLAIVRFHSECNDNIVYNNIW